jgi:hypothetical protein
LLIFVKAVMAGHPLQCRQVYSLSVVGMDKESNSFFAALGTIGAESVVVLHGVLSNSKLGDFPFWFGHLHNGQRNAYASRLA